MAAKATKDGAVVEFIKTVVYALVLAGLIRTLLFQPFWIPSGSMKDTLLIGDFLFVNKFAYGYSKHSCPWSMCPFSGRVWSAEPERGDVIVFTHPQTNVAYIKRVVGLPGDSVQMKDGMLYLNGEVVPQSPVGDFEETKERQGPIGGMPSCANAPVPVGGSCTKEKAIEALPGGVSHGVLNIRSGPGDNTGVYNVPPGHYFFVGDNRDNSLDSRYAVQADGVGFVPFENLVGRADRVIFSSAGSSILAFWTWRSDRYFKAIN